MAPSGDKRSFEERKAALLSGEKRAKIERDLQARGFRGVSSSIEHITDLRNSLLNTQSTPARDGYPYTNMQKLPATMGSQFNAYVELCGSLQGFGFLKSANENTFNCGVSVTVDYGKKTFDPKLVLRFTYSHDYCEPLAKTRKDGSSTNDMFWLARVGQQADNDAYQLKSVEPSVMTAEKRRYLGVSTDGDGEYVRFRVTCSGWFHKTSDSNFMDYNKAHDHFGKVHPKNADAERSFFKALYDGREVVLDLYVHVNTNAKNYIDEQFPYFQAAIAARVTRLWPYLKATNEDPPQYVCKVNLDLDDVRSICGGILCTYDSNTIAHAERLKTSGERPDKCADWPTPKSVTQITNGEADMVGMGSIQAMQVMMQGAVVREYQATRRPFAVFSTDRVSLTVVKFDRPSTSSTNTNIAFYVVVNLTPYLRRSASALPETNTVWEVSSPQFCWRGIQKPMRVDHKKKLGYGDFVVVCVPPPEETANGDIGASSFDTVTHRDCFPNSVVIPNDDQTTAKRILASIQRLTTTDAGKRYSPVIDYVGSVGSQETKDLTRGPERIIWHKGNPAEVHTQAFDDNDGLFDTALDVFARQAGYTPSEQKRVLNRPKSVSRRTIAVVGGPGTGKTSTCTKMAFCLLLVQHKFLVVALQNGVVDHWTTEMVRRKSEFELVARILLNEQKRLQQTTVVQKTTKRLQTLIERCNNLKLLRALPPPYESKMMDRIDQGFAIGQKGSTYDTTDTTDSAVHEDPLYREGVVQKMLWEEEIQTEAALGAVVEKNYLELERAAERMHELEHQHDDVLRVDSRAFKFPLECSEQYYIREARKNPNGVPDRLKEAVSQHDSTREEVKALGANLNLKERREVLSRYKEARNELYAAVVEQSDMVVTTLSTSQHELVASNCKPDGVILEEAGNVDVATALQAWTYCPEFRASIGDPAQFEPWALSTGRDSEFREMTKFSDLQAWISRGYEHDRLYEQKRAAPGLMAAVSKETYQSQLYDAELTKEMAKDRKALVHREVMWKNHIHVDGLNPDWQACHLFYLKSVDDQATRTDQGESLYNDQELDVVMRDLREYAAKGMPTSEITVLVYYREQLKHIKSRLAAEPSLNKVEVETVRKYQGRSNSIVLVLFTAPYVDEPPHFSAHVLDAGGLTVALSCARFGFCFYGSWLELVRKVRVETWTAKNQHGLILRLCCNAILDGYMLNSTSFEVDKLAERMLPRQVLNTMQRDLRLKPKKSSQTWSTSYVGNTGMTPLPFMDRATQMQKMVDPTGAQATEAAKENKALASEMVGGQVDQDQDMND